MTRALALEIVKELLERGYTADHADRETCAGFDSCDESGRSYIIRKGTITVPGFGGQDYRFRALANELAGKRIAPKPRRPKATLEQLALL